ncbi:MAG: polyphenol oxidase family protein [Acidimicrobiales bacterium]
MGVDDLPLGDGVRAVVTTRHGGVSAAAEGADLSSLNLADHPLAPGFRDDHLAVVANRRLVCDTLRLPALTIADQQHQATVAYVDADLAGVGHDSHEQARQRLPATDGLVTDQPGVALTILVADCVPVAFFDPVHQAIGAAHAGRLGTIAGVVPNVIAEMGHRFGSRPADLRVAFGPHVGPTSYEVGPTEVATFRAAFGDDRLLHPTIEGRASLDLEGALRRQLAAAGVPPASITSTGVDTYEATDRYFSHRRAHPCGRFALIVWLPAR